MLTQTEGTVEIQEWSGLCLWEGEWASHYWCEEGFSFIQESLHITNPPFQTPGSCFPPKNQPVWEKETSLLGTWALMVSINCVLISHTDQQMPLQGKVGCLPGIIQWTVNLEGKKYVSPIWAFSLQFTILFHPRDKWGAMGRISNTCYLVTKKKQVYLWCDIISVCSQVIWGDLHQVSG